MMQFYTFAAAFVFAVLVYETIHLDTSDHEAVVIYVCGAVPATLFIVLYFLRLFSQIRR